MWLGVLVEVVVVVWMKCVVVVVVVVVVAAEAEKLEQVAVQSHLLAETRHQL